MAFPFPAPVPPGAEDGQLVPRAPLTKLPNGELEAFGGGSGRLVVKFMDAVKARATPDGSVFSLVNRDLRAVADIALGAELKFAPTIKLPQESLSAIEGKAAAYSKRAQPDLGGMMYVATPDGGPVPLEAAQALNDLDFVEFVYFEPTYVVDEGPTGACCLSDGSCADISEAACDAAEGDYHGDGTTCANVCEACSGSCFDLDGNGTPGCFSRWDPACCQTVCDFTPELAACCTVEWDDFCAAVAQLICNPVCGQEDAGDCFTDNGSPYCEDEDCCNTVCEIEPLCCDVANMDGWDDFCADLANLFCGQPGCGNNSGGCFEINGILGCQDEDCCNLVCDLDPFCCNDDALWPGRGSPRWDPWCVEHAQVLCGANDPAALCSSADTGPCFEPHEQPGCTDAACCVTVCAVEPFCCSVIWDGMCASLALQLCLSSDPGGATPSFTPAQGYLSPFTYVQDNGELPPAIVPGLQFDVDGILLDGFQGQGYNMQGLWELAEQFLPNFPGTENLTRGKTMKVGIIEHSAFIETAKGPDAPYRHEDLHGKVIPEPGQTIIIIPGNVNLSGHHGTATLGIVGAIDHDDDGNEVPDGLSPDESRAQERGIVGLAPEAELYFFPIVSLEEGGRLLSAIASAILAFDQGDVLSFSIGPSGCGTLASSQGAWLMLRLAADAGITCCISAGNDCCNLGTAPQFGGEDSGVIIVGAVFPGRGGFNRYCRLSFSNYCQSCDPEVDAVHISAWGTSVATLGYGTMFFPNGDLNRSYANAFNGTSAAAPQVAALVASLQGFSKVFYGLPLRPEDIRDIVRSNGWNQCGFHDPDDLPGNSDDPPCLADWDFGDAANRIGVRVDGHSIAYTDPLTAAKAIIQSGIFDCDSLIESFEIYRGTRISGNINSLRCPDGIFLTVKSQYTQPTDNIHLGIVYLGPGHITDVFVVARSDLDNPANLTMNIQTTIVPQGQFTTLFLIFGELFDFNQNRWVPVGFDLVDIILNGTGPFLFNYSVPDGSASSFLREGDNLVLMRVWTLTLGGVFGGGFGGGTPNTAHVMHHDWIGLDTSGGPGDIIIPP